MPSHALAYLQERLAAAQSYGADGLASVAVENTARYVCISYPKYGLAPEAAMTNKHKIENHDPEIIQLQGDPNLG